MKTSCCSALTIWPCRRTWSRCCNFIWTGCNSWAYGNTRDQGHLSWHRRPNGEGWDFPYLRGAISTRSEGTKRRDVFGITNTPVQLIDGVLIAVQRQQLLDHGVGFDPRFHFHFYDLDLCRTARRQGLTIGVIRLDCIHASGGDYGSAAWREEADATARRQLPFVSPRARPTGAELPTGIQKAPARLSRAASPTAPPHLEAEAAFAQAVNQNLITWSWLQRQQPTPPGLELRRITPCRSSPSSSRMPRRLASLGLLHQQQGAKPDTLWKTGGASAQPKPIGLLADAPSKTKPLTMPSHCCGRPPSLGQQPKAVGLGTASHTCWPSAETNEKR